MLCSRHSRQQESNGRVDPYPITPHWVILAFLCYAAPVVQAAEPDLKDLGGDRFQLGQIQIDRGARSFSLPGVMIKDDQPLEYLAVKKGGLKAYEAVLELHTTSSEFNLACILIGLDADNAVLPRYHFDERPAEGDPVRIQITWEVEGQTRSISPEQLFQVIGEPTPSANWVYTGSIMLPDGRYLAEEAGTLIGFVHDQDSIIEHREGIGLGNFGSVQIDRALAPALGTTVKVTVTNLAPAKP